jgi:cathepsin A (carboxypeptidase C)
LWQSRTDISIPSQPAGVGFSTVSSTTQSPVTLATAAIDFNIFLSVFYSSLFPSLSNQPLHIAGESFGGRYVPAYTKYIVEQQKSNRKPSVPAKINSIVLISASVDHASTSLGEIDHFCSDSKRENGFGSGFNTTACSAMKRAASACERAGRTCRNSFTQVDCRQAMNTCNQIGKWFGQGVKAGGNNPYDGEHLSTTTCQTLANDYIRSFEMHQAPRLSSN